MTGHLYRAVAPAVAALLLGAACATGGGAGASGDQQDASAERHIELRVHNGIAPRTSLAVYLRSGSGTRSFIGRVGPGRTETFDHTVASLSGDYRLEAESTSGSDQEIRSRSFTLFAGAEVTWTLPQNSILVGYHAGSDD